MTVYCSLLGSIYLSLVVFFTSWFLLFTTLRIHAIQLGSGLHTFFFRAWLRQPSL